MDWKAITIGFIATLIIGLCVQLAYVLIATLIGIYSASLPVIAQHKETLWLVAAIFGFSITMLIGGAITMMAARTQRLTNPLIVGVLVTIISVVAPLSDSELTLKSIVLILAGALFSILGGHWIRRRDRAKMPSASGAQS